MKQFYLLLLLFAFNVALAQQADSVLLAKDSTAIPVAEPLKPSLEKLLNENKYLNSKGIPESLVAKPKKVNDQDILFYLLVSFIFIFGIIRSVYARYFSTLFRVFFNSSLRQSQLTDQLLQSKLPSLFFNLIFLIAGGLYVYFLLQRIGHKSLAIDWVLLGASVAAFMIVYLVKFLTLKFVGWVTGYKQEADTYIFVVFLINKIIGIFLLPVIIVLSFSLPSVSNIFVMVSFILIGVMISLRFFRSYGLLQHKLNVSRFHFLVYIFSLEILPLLIMYKAIEVFVVKNL